jgi:hypothetical protein
MIIYIYINKYIYIYIYKYVYIYICIGSVAQVRPSSAPKLGKGTKQALQLPNEPSIHSHPHSKRQHQRNHLSTSPRQHVPRKQSQIQSQLDNQFMDTSLHPESEASKSTKNSSPHVVVNNGINDNSESPLSKTLSVLLTDNSNHIDKNEYNSFGNRTLKKRSLSLPTNKINAPLNKSSKDKSTTQTIASQTNKSSIIKSLPLSSIESDSSTEKQIGINDNTVITEGIKDSSNGELNEIKGLDVPNDHKLSIEIHVSVSKDVLKVPLTPILCLPPLSIEYPLGTGICIFYYLYIDSLTYTFGWSNFCAGLGFVTPSL